MELKKCKTCGKEISETAQVCPHCGETLPCLYLKCPKCGSIHITEKREFFSPQGFVLGIIVGVCFCLVYNTTLFTLIWVSLICSLIGSFRYCNQSFMTCQKCGYFIGNGNKK